ncbi:MAG: S-layer homology domain-containing protein, partial [Firmicutes bacterium]|nr:S-layer homology domain-containing protein [Bacillota bacterium]
MAGIPRLASNHSPRRASGSRAGGGKETPLTRRYAYSLAVVAAVLFLPTGHARAAGDRWYDDMAGHWSSRYVRVLWEEEVTDGECRVTGHEDHPHKRYLYHPSAVSSRSQYAMLLAKVFRLAPVNDDHPLFSDVPTNYSIYDKPAFGYIQAAAREGIILGYPDGRFEPGSGLTREQA